MGTGRKFGEVDTAFMAEEEFHAPNAGTGESFRNLGSHALCFGQVLFGDVCRLETFAIVATLLHVSDGRTEEGGPVFLCYGEQCDFAVEMNELFNDKFLNITTTAADAVFPCVWQFVSGLHQRLTFAR